MKFLDSVGTWIENPRYVEFNNWFYKQNHENVISLMVTNNRTVWGWLKQYAFEIDGIILEILYINPKPREQFRAKLIDPKGGKNNTARIIYQEAMTFDHALVWLVRKYFNYERGQ